MGLLNEFLEHIEYDDLNEGLQLIAEKTDIDTVRALMVHHPEERIYIKPAQSCRSALKKFIANQMLKSNKLDVRKIAIELNVKKSMIQTIKREIDQELLGN